MQIVGSHTCVAMGSGSARATIQLERFSCVEVRGGAGSGAAPCHGRSQAGVASSRSTRVGADGRSVCRAWHRNRHRTGVRPVAFGGRGSPVGDLQARLHGRRRASPNAVPDGGSHRFPARAEARPGVAPSPTSTTATAPANCTRLQRRPHDPTPLGSWRIVTPRWIVERISSPRRLRARASE
jgi:hypothetical protein